MMSAFGSVDLALEARQRGAYDYISKPFKQDEVLLTLRKAEERLRLRRENANLRARVHERLRGFCTRTRANCMHLHRARPHPVLECVPGRATGGAVDETITTPGGVF